MHVAAHFKISISPVARLVTDGARVWESVLISQVFQVLGLNVGKPFVLLCVPRRAVFNVNCTERTNYL
jgi:hypothetical protein